MHHESALTRRRLLAAASALAAAAALPRIASAAPAADGGRNLLERFLERVSAAEGAFRQTTTDRSGKTVNAAEGVFAFRRPGAFLWNYEKPWRQQVVSDGKTLWLYDEDLAQVTVKPMSGALGSTPAALLFGEGVIPESWTVGSDAGAVRLIPDKPQAGFESMLIVFGPEGNPERMTLVDSFAQTTVIEFTRFEPKTSIDAKRFDFRIPEGVDVMRDAGV